MRSAPAATRCVCPPPLRRGCQVCSFARLTRGGALCAQAALLAPPPLPPRTDFARGAASVGAGIAALRAFAAARRRDYTEPGRVSEAERDAIEAEVSAAIRDCRERIDALKEAAPAAAAAAAAEASKHVRGGAWTRGADGGGDMLAHHTGVVLILAERLTDVAERFDRQRAARLRSSSQAATLRRRRAPLPVRALRCAARRCVFRAEHSVPPPQPPPPQPPPPPAQLPSGASAQQAAMLQESYSLAQDLAQLVDGARAAEARMVEVSALSSTFAAHVAAQAQQIEALCVIFAPLCATCACAC